MALSEDGSEGAAPTKKRTRRGSRGGRGRKKKTPAAASTEAEAERDATESSSENGETNWEYVPMSEWESDLTGSGS